MISMGSTRRAPGLIDLAEQLGLGRPDAAVSELTQESRRRPVEVAREFARRLDTQPDDPALRKGLVTALLRAGEANGAALALAPLVTAAPDDPEVRMLAAEVKGAQGRIRQGRSLYNSILRNDPLAADAHAGLLALAEYSEWGVSAGYEYDVVRDTSDLGAGFADWQEAFLSTYWRRPFRQTWTLEYRWYDRHEAQAHQLGLDWTRALGRDWILRLNAAGAQDEEIIAQWRLGGGISRRLADTVWVGLDGRYLDFVDVNVWQLIPGVTWRWHPRGTIEGRLYLSENRFETGTTEASLTWLVQASWQIGRQSLATLFYAQGDEDSLDPIPGLIANDRYLSVGGSLRLGLNRHWVLQPAYRFERHEQFDLHGLGLTLTRRY
jgi:YaiO family outer membrane protein